MRIIAFVFLSAVLTKQAVAGQFSSGFQFEATPYFGVVTVLCPTDSGGFKEAEFSCRKSELLPRETDYFYGPAGVNADRIVFTNRLENRSTRTKTENYDQTKSRTRAEVNLWQDSVFQAPLLGMGLNQIKFQLYKDRGQLTEGTLSVQVSRKNTVRCQSRQILGYHPNDCENQVWACEAYFSSPNVCK
jgi:hypothetical protein